MSVEIQTEALNEKKSKNEISKQTYRKKVWEHLEKNNLADFPRPVYSRIPNFIGSNEAAAKLLELVEFNKVKSVEVNPDKPQEAARILALEQKKKLYVPVPRLKMGLLKYVQVPENAIQAVIKKAVNRKGLEYNGTTIDVKDNVKIELLVLGCVAVSKEGYRIGKGRGYVDLEYAILSDIKAVNEDTVIVTIVHDSQVFDNMPKEIFQPYDVPVDIILTPTQIIRVENRLPRPKGIFWHLLSQRKLNLMPVLQSLKQIHEREGKDTTLKEADTDIETYDSRKLRNYRRYQRKRPRSVGKTSESQGEDVAIENNRRRVQRSRKIYSRRKLINNEEKRTENEDSGTELKNLQQIRKPYRKNRPPIDFSLMVSNIQKDVRVRDLKNALNEKGIKPNDITWHGYKGVCYLHYAKPNIKAVKENRPPVVVDNVIEILQNLKIHPDSESLLSVKIMEPITRIETANITAV